MNEVDEELFEHHRLVADKGQEPLRVDKFLLNRLEKELQEIKFNKRLLMVLYTLMINCKI